MTKAYILIGGALALLGTLNAAQAQTARTICGDRDQIVDTLTGRLGETAQSWGMGPSGRIVEVFASEETGTWTITITAPNGTTCLVAAGQYWENLMPLPLGEAT